MSKYGRFLPDYVYLSARPHVFSKPSIIPYYSQSFTNDLNQTFELGRIYLYFNSHVHTTCATIR